MLGGFKDFAHQFDLLKKKNKARPVLPALHSFLNLQPCDLPVIMLLPLPK